MNAGGSSLNHLIRAAVAADSSSESAIALSTAFRLSERVSRMVEATLRHYPLIGHGSPVSALTFDSSRLSAPGSPLGLSSRKRPFTGMSAFRNIA